MKRNRASSGAGGGNAGGGSGGGDDSGKNSQANITSFFFKKPGASATPTTIKPSCEEVIKRQGRGEEIELEVDKRGDEEGDTPTGSRDGGSAEVRSPKAPVAKRLRGSTTAPAGGSRGGP